MKKLLCVSLLLFATTASAHESLDLAQCFGQLTYDALGDHPNPDNLSNIKKLHNKLAHLDANVVIEIQENTMIFFKSLEWTNMLSDATAYNNIKATGQQSCDKVLK